MKVIGIVGGIASGKSCVSAEFEARGAKRIDADRIGHELLKSPPVKEAVARVWGGSVFRDGEIDRSLLAGAVFGDSDPEQILRLNGILHPRIAGEVEKELAACRAGSSPLVIIDAPLLYEVHLDRLCDLVLFVDADFSRRAERAARRGWTREELRVREARQMPLEEKKARADLVIDNNGPPEMIYQQIEQIFPRHNS